MSSELKMGRTAVNCLLATMTAFALVAKPASADEYNGTLAADRGNWSVGVTAGTLGAGIEASLRLHPNIIIRGDVTYGDLGFVVDDMSISAGTIAGDQSITGLTLMSAALMVDWHPFRDGARITAGARYFDAELEGEAKNGDAISFTAKSSSTVLPYVGFGYDSSFFKDYGLSLSTDFGALIGPSFDVDVTSAALSTAEKATAAKEIKDNIEQLGVYPVIMLSGKYRF